MGMQGTPATSKPKRTREDYSTLLDRIALNLLHLSPSEVKDEDIVELEGILNELYSQAYMESWSIDLQTAILQALSRAAELHEQRGYRKTRAPRDRHFFLTLKQFTPQLQMIAAYLDD